MVSTLSILPSAASEPDGISVTGIVISLGVGVAIWLVATFVISRITRRVAAGSNFFKKPTFRWAAPAFRALDHERRVQRAETIGSLLNSIVGVLVVVITGMYVLQNLDIAAGAGRGPLTMLRRRKGVPEEVTRALETTGLTALRDRPAGVLAHGQKQWLEIGMLLVKDVRLLLLDEPVAGMSHDEREATGRLLRRISEDRTVVVIEHDMDFMRSFAHSVSVLHAGKVLSEGSVTEVQADARVQEVYLGRASEPEPAAVPVAEEA